MAASGIPLVVNELSLLDNYRVSSARRRPRVAAAVAYQSRAIVACVAGIVLVVVFPDARPTKQLWTTSPPLYYYALLPLMLSYWLYLGRSYYPIIPGVLISLCRKKCKQHEIPAWTAHLAAGSTTRAHRAIPPSSDERAALPREDCNDFNRVV